tara:strand:- start:1721 stop:2152 length:432 start_codon:yes stop_codon:yes gene_type:complete
METQKKLKPGRKKIVLDIEEIERLAGMGLSERQIAAALGISNSTLTRKKHIEQIGHALKKGRAKALAQVSSKLFENALDGKETSAIFFLKNRDPENWSDRQEVNHNINLKEIMKNSKSRLIEGEIVEKEAISVPLPKKKALEE